MDIKRLNEITGDILRYEESIWRITYNLARIGEGNLSFTAKTIIKTEGRLEYTHYLNKEEVCAFLERKLSEETQLLEKAKKVYEELINETTD